MAASCAAATVVAWSSRFLLLSLDDDGRWGARPDLRVVGADNWRDVWLVDDVEAFVVPEQRGQWVRIDPFLAPYPDADRALAAVRAELEQRLTHRMN